jgi:hypothetical protein
MRFVVVRWGSLRVVHVNAHLLDRVGNVGPGEGEEDQVRGEAVVSRSRCLLQAIEGHVELTHQLRVHRVNEAGGLRAVAGIGECAVEEGVLDVELVHGATPGDSQSQHSPNSGRLDDGAEGLIIVHPGVLSEAQRTQ